MIDPERLNTFNLDHLVTISHMRAGVTGFPHFTNSQVDNFLRVQKVREDEQKQQSANTEDTRADLLVMKQLLEKGRGKVPSRPYICAHLVYRGLYDPVLRQALTCYYQTQVDQRYLPVFIGYYDYSQGVAEIPAIIFEAEEETRGIAEALNKETVEHTEQELGSIFLMRFETPYLIY